VRAAWQLAHGAGATSPALDLHLQGAIAAARYVRRAVSRTEAATIGEATVALITRRWQAHGGSAALRNVLIVGAGEVGESVALALAAHRASGGLPAQLSVRIANRTAVRAEALAAQCGGTPVNWTQWPDLLSHHDVVIFSARSARPLVTRVQSAEAAAGRRGAALWVDLASPPNVEAADLSPIAYATLADLAHADADVPIDLAHAEQVMTREVQLFRDAQHRRQAWPGLKAGQATGDTSPATLHAH
jgi:glutamyl-tRNA reductase